MKKVLKYILYIILSLFIFIILLTVIAKITEDKITHLVLERVSKQIQAPVTIEHVSFKLLRKFPLATIELNGVCLQSQNDVNETDSSIAAQDTILSIQRLFFSVKTKPLFNSVFEIVKIEIDGADINYSVDSLGITNIDFLLDTTQTEDTSVSAPLNLTLKELRIKNTSCTYSDAVLKANALVFIPEIKINAKAKDDKYSASVKGNMELSNCAFEGTNLHLMQKMALKFKIDYDNNDVEINQLEVNTDGAQLSVSGSATLGDTLITELEISGQKWDLAELIKYAPNGMLKEYGVNNVAGLIDFESTVKGMYADSLLPEVTLNIEMKKGSLETQDYPALKNLAFKGTLTNGLMRNNKTTQVDFKSFHVETEQSKFDVAFKIVDIDHPKYEVKTDFEITVQEFKNFIPDSLLKSIEGVVSASIYTKGQLPDSIGDDFVDYIAANSSATINFKNFNINLDDTLIINSFSAGLIYAPNLFKINNLSVSVPAYKVHLKNTSLDTKILGKLSNPESLDFDIKKLQIETNKSKFTISGRIKNPENPKYKVQTHLSLNLAEVKTMLPDTLMKTLSGTVLMDINSWGTLNLDSIAEQANEIVFKQTDFNIRFKDVYVEMPDDPMTKVENFGAKIIMNPQHISINKLAGNFAGVDFAMDSTEILNVYETFIQERRDIDLIVQTVIDMGTIDYNKLMVMMPVDTATIKTDSTKNTPTESALTKNTQISPTKEGETLTESQAIETEDTANIQLVSLLPDFNALGIPHFLMRGRVTVKQIKYEKNVLDEISLLFRFADSLYVIDQFKLKTCGGEVNTSVKFDARKWEQPLLDIKNEISHMDLRQLLMDNDNFGDTVLTYDKVTGTLTSMFHIRLFFIGDSIPTEKIRVKGEFTLENGRIYDYKPLAELSKNIGGLKELDKLEFNTLNSSIFMFKNKIYIPKTNVVSSAMDISAFAMQSMADDYEYHLVVHLSDVLAGKSTKLIEEQAKQSKRDGITEERNGLSLVSMQIGADKRNGFDNAKLKKKFQNDLNRQQGFLNLLFDPGLVNFSTELDRTARNRAILKDDDAINHENK